MGRGSVTYVIDDRPKDSMSIGQNIQSLIINPYKYSNNSTNLITNMSEKIMLRGKYIRDKVWCAQTAETRD